MSSAWIYSIEEAIHIEDGEFPVLDHEQCRFNAWLNGDGKRYSHLLVYQQITMLHEEIHEQAKVLYQLEAAG